MAGGEDGDGLGVSGADGAVETSRVPGGVERGPWRVRLVREAFPSISFL